MPTLALGQTISKILYGGVSVSGAERVEPSIGSQLGGFGNSNCFYLNAFADIDLIDVEVAFNIYEADFVIDGVRIQIDELGITSGISSAAMNNPVNTDAQIILDAKLIGAGFVAYNGDPDPGIGPYGFCGIMYDGDTFVTAVTVASDQTFFDYATDSGNSNISVLNRDDLNTLHFKVTGGYVTVALDTGAYEFNATPVEIDRFLFCNNDIGFYAGPGGSLFDLDNNEYLFTDQTIYNGFGGPAIMYDGTYFYLINNSFNFPAPTLIRFVPDGETYDIIQVDNDYIFGVNQDNRIEGGLAE